MRGTGANAGTEYASLVFSAGAVLTQVSGSTEVTDGAEVEVASTTMVISAVPKAVLSLAPAPPPQTAEGKHWDMCWQIQTLSSPPSQ